MTTRREAEVKLPKYKIVQYLFECYNEFKEYAEREGEFFIEYQGSTVSYLDLQNQLWKVSPRKRQALELHLVFGYKQIDCAKIMNISPVTVGQYTKAACKLIAKEIFGEEE